MPERRPEPYAAQLLVGYDGSPSAAGAIDAGGLLMPSASATVVHLWAPPFASAELRRRLWHRSRSLDDLARLMEEEGRAEAERVAANGVALARAAGWSAEPLTERTYGDEGMELARLAERLRPSAVVVGSRGLTGLRAMLGSTSDALAHFSPVPVLVVPHPVLSAEREAASEGAVLVGYDGSDGARVALASAAALLAGRKLLVATVGDDDARVVDAAELEGLGADAEALEVDAGGGRAKSPVAVADALAAAAADREAAVVAVGSRGRSAGREILLGSVAMAVLHTAQRPVLVVPSEDRYTG